MPKYKFVGNCDLEVWSDYNDEADCGEKSIERFKAGEIVDFDIINENDEGTHVDIQFGDGDVALTIDRTWFEEVKAKDNMTVPFENPADLAKDYGEKLDEIAEANDGAGMLQGWSFRIGLIDLVFEHRIITVDYEFNLVADRPIYRIDEQDSIEKVGGRLNAAQESYECAVDRHTQFCKDILKAIGDTTDTDWTDDIDVLGAVKDFADVKSEPGER